MGRVWRGWAPKRSAHQETAPHRYTWDGDRPDPALADDYKTWKALVPYKEGEVIFIERAGRSVRALIIDVHRRRDSMDFPIEAYKVVAETRKGLWSRVFEYAYPGTVQRGYHRAGLAPDLDGR